MDLFSAVSEASTSQPSGQDGKTPSIANSTHSGGKSSTTTGRKPQVMKTSPRQTSLFGEDESMSSQAGSHASPTQWQGSDSAKRTSAIFGRQCLQRFEQYPRAGSWAKMFSALLIGMEGWSSTRCRLTWRLKGTRFNRMYFQLQVSTLPIEGTGCGLLLTPSTVDIVPDEKRFHKRTEYRASVGRKWTPGSLTEQVFHGLLPTPRANKVNGCDMNSENLANRNKGNLEETIAGWVVNGMLPTPTARCWNTGTDKERPEWQPSRRSELNHLVAQENGSPSQLSPLFTTEMMGFPESWLVLPFQGGETNQ